MKAVKRDAREMKDSGIEWIGQIPQNWKIYKLKYLIHEPLQYGANAVGQIYDEKLPRYVRITDISSEGILRSINRQSLSQEMAEPYLLEDGDVLLARSGATVGKAFLYKKSDGICAFAGYLIRAKCKNSKIAKLLYYYTASISYEIWKNGIFNQATIQNIGAEKYANMKIPLSLADAEQQAISDYLDDRCAKIDAIIAEAKASIEEYRELKTSLIDESVTKGVLENIDFKDSGLTWLKKIPVTWKIAPSKALFSQSNERKYDGDEQLTSSQKYGIISQKDYMEREQSRVVIATQGIENWKHVEPNDFIISLRSFQGGLEKSDISGCITWHYIVLRPKKDVYPEYFKWLLKSSKYINALQSTCNFIRDGQDLRFSNFVQVPLFIIPMKEQKEIAEYLNLKIPQIDMLISEKQSLIEDLEFYKKSLIYEVVTGKRKVVAG